MFIVYMGLNPADSCLFYPLILKRGITTQLEKKAALFVTKNEIELVSLVTSLALLLVLSITVSSITLFRT